MAGNISHGAGVIGQGFGGAPSLAHTKEGATGHTIILVGALRRTNAQRQQITSRKPLFA
jgi:hypothetical protein